MGTAINDTKLAEARDNLVKHIGLLAPLPARADEDDACHISVCWTEIAKAMDALICATIQDIADAGGRADRYTPGTFIDLIDDAFHDSLNCLQRQIERENTPAARAERTAEWEMDYRREDAA